MAAQRRKYVSQTAWQDPNTTSAPDASAAASRSCIQPGLRRTPPSVKASQGWAAFSTPAFRARPGKSSPVRTTRTGMGAGNASTIPPVPSSEPASTTTSSSGSRLWAAMDSIKGRTVALSLRSGTIREPFSTASVSPQEVQGGDERGGVRSPRHQRPQLDPTVVRKVPDLYPGQRPVGQTRGQRHLGQADRKGREHGSGPENDGGHGTGDGADADAPLQEQQRRDRIGDGQSHDAGHETGEDDARPREAAPEDEGHGHRRGHDEEEPRGRRQQHRLASRVRGVRGQVLAQGSGDDEGLRRLRH